MKTGRKPHPSFPESRKKLAHLLNISKGPLNLSHNLGVSKVTVHSWMNHYGIESKYF